MAGISVSPPDTDMEVVDSGGDATRQDTDIEAVCITPQSVGCTEPMTTPPWRASSRVKQPRGIPSTPQGPVKKVPLRVRELSAPMEPRLAMRGQRFSSDFSTQEWQSSELTALIEFVMFHTNGQSWPTHKRPTFWGAAAEYVQMRAGTVNMRSSKLKKFLGVFYCSIK